jgi:ribosomal protein L11 methyltransferase
MFLWQKSAERRWVNAHEDALQARTGGALVIVSRPARKRLQLEIICRSRTQGRALVCEFGGRAEKLPGNWLRERVRLQKTKPLRIGNRLILVRSGGFPAGKPFRVQKSHLFIPAGAAFGTGDHVTTSMSLRLLEQLSRRWSKGWSLVDLGTGSGILALAAKHLGAGHVVGIDSDPTAISTAKSNARRNNIRNVHFQLADVRKWKPCSGRDVVTANLYSDLLSQILRNLKRSQWLILSGVLRTQEKEFIRAVRRYDITIVARKRRGKWIAVLARCSSALRNPPLGGPSHFILRRS